MAAPETTTPAPRSRMDRQPHPFDHLVTLTGRGAPRRRVLQGLLSAVLAAVPGTFHHERAAAQPCKGVGKRCQNDGDCCSVFCEPISRQCVARCSQADAFCGQLTPCAPGCSCYAVELGQPFSGRACLQDPVGGTTTPGQECPGTEQCAAHLRDKEHREGCPCRGPADCPKGYLCTGASCCRPDSVCLRLCDPDAA